jgi:type I restriction enzyme, S subunit
MGSSWQVARLGDHVEMLFGFAFKSAGFTTESGAIRLVRGDNITEGQLRWGEKTRRWPCVTSELERYLLRDGDVVIGMDGSKVGRNWARIRTSDLPLLLVQRVARLRPRSTLASGFIPLLIGSAAFRRHVDAVKTGSSIPHISGKQIGEFEFLLPPRYEQDAIAATLGALDDKIELNRRMNETLDHIAGSWFDRWFLTGEDLPAEADGAIPMDDWAARPLDHIADFLNGAACQKYPARDGEPSLPVIKIRELNQGITKQSDRVTQQIPEKWHVRNGDVLFSWSGTLIAKVWTGDPAALNQHLFKVTSTEYPKWFYLRWVLHHLDHFRGVAADKATTMGHIKRHHLTDAMCRVPPQPVLQAMTQLMEPLLDRQVVCENESSTLAAIRDALLPKLISGELRIPDAERLVSEVT